MHRSTRLTQVSGILNQIIRQYGLEGKFREYRLAQQWEEIVGETIAGHSRPEAIRFRKLILRVDSSVWIQQLSFFKKEMIEKANNALGGRVIDEVQLRVGPMEDP
jgi:predicted nucleic acid-binding Zn ribbon protein